jgi:hypothetical protein
MFRRTLVPLLFTLASCATVAHSDSADSALRASVVRTARGLIGQRDLWLAGKELPADCLSLPRVAYGANGFDLSARTPAALYQQVRRDGHWFAGGRPRRGDLVFLQDSDRARSVHVGLVGGIEQDGTVVVLQRMARGVTAYRMNPRHPHDEHAPGELRSWNDTIASQGDGAPAGALFSGYASLLP